MKRGIDTIPAALFGDLVGRSFASKILGECFGVRDARQMGALDEVLVV